MPIELEVATGTRIAAQQDDFTGQAHRLLEGDDNLDIGRRQVRIECRQSPGFYPQAVANRAGSFAVSLRYNPAL